MTDKAAYSYTLLRYVHDVLTGEFVNVGVVLFVPSKGLVRYKMRGTIGRLKGVFPDIDRRAFLSSMTAVRKGLQLVGKSEKEAGLLKSEGDAVAIARRAVPPDDSSLQWSPSGTGLTANPDEALDRLFDRYVSRYDTHHRSRRSDDDVWRPVRRSSKSATSRSIFRKNRSAEVWTILSSSTPGRMASGTSMSRCRSILPMLTVSRPKHENGLAICPPSLPVARPNSSSLTLLLALRRMRRCKTLIAAPSRSLNKLRTIQKFSKRVSLIGLSLKSRMRFGNTTPTLNAQLKVNSRHSQLRLAFGLNSESRCRQNVELPGWPGRKGNKVRVPSR